MSTLDDRLRGRLAEIRAAAGVPHAQISLEVLYFLPKGFLDAYAELFTRALKADGGEGARGEAQQQTGALGKARVIGGGGAKPAKRRWKKAWVVQDDRLLEVKTLMDKRLRVLAKEIQRLLEGGADDDPVLTCSACRVVVSTSWKYCPRCGTHQVRD